MISSPSLLARLRHEDEHREREALAALARIEARRRAMALHPSRLGPEVER